LVQRSLSYRAATTPGRHRASRKLGRALVVREATLPTNYLLGYYPGPTARDPDYQVLRIATAVLSGRFFTEIRSRRNLSYEVEAPFVERAISNGGIYVTTTDPNATLELMRAEIERLQREMIDPRGLERSFNNSSRISFSRTRRTATKRPFSLARRSTRATIAPRIVSSTI
jgi:predicted Zn-dependent peptidase